MIRHFVSLATAAFVLGAALPATAQTGAYYSATLAGSFKKASLVTGSTLWKCKDGVCSAPKGADRDAVMCEMVAQRTGELTAFTANGAAFDEAALKKCNARAR